MAQYNLINNGLVNSLTTSGTGNKTLSWSEYILLHDGITTVSGINLSSSDILYLEVDLSRRIKVDEINLYLENTTVLDKVNFYYRDTSLDSYIICGKSYTGICYNATIPEPSAPQYILITISGVNCDLYELEVLNDDYTVAFGENGDQTAISMGAVPTGEESGVFTSYIYNNSQNAMPADAYVVVDYTDTDADKYLKLSSTYGGAYYGIYDGINITDNSRANDYYWDLGTFDNVSIQASNTLKISNIDTSYTSKFTTLPLQGYTDIFGVSAAPWHYDKYNKLLYVVIAETSFSTAAKVYVYSFDNNTWTYVCTLPVTGYSYGSSYVTMTLHGRYLYFTMSAYETDDFWGRHCLDGTYDDWEWLADPGSLNGNQWAGNQYGATCSGGDYIYIINSDNNFFGRYNVNTDSWASLDYSYSEAGSTWPIRLSFVYDDVRNCLYLDCGSAGSDPYVQKYFIGTNSWDATYLNYVSRIGYSNTCAAIDYYDNKIYFNDPSYGTKIYIYDIATDSFSYKNTTGFIRDLDEPSRMLVLPPLDTEDVFSLIMCNVVGDNYGLYGHNVPNANDNIDYTSGTYTTPVLDLGSKYNASYVLVEGTTTSGLSTISYNENVYDGTIRIRGSNTKPQPEIFIYWPRHYNGDFYVDKYNPITNSTSVLTSNGDAAYTEKAASSIRSGNFLVSGDNSSYDTNNYCYIYNESGSLLYRQDVGWADYSKNYFYFAFFTKTDNIWAYSNEYEHLHLIRYDLSSTLLVNKSLPDLIDMAVDEDGEGVWYIDSSLNHLTHLDSSGNSICFIMLTSPTKVCGEMNNGCWVYDSSSLTINKYSYYGDLITSMSVTYAVTFLTSDLNGGFFYINTNDEIKHINSEAVETLSITGITSDVTYIEGCPYGCLLHKSGFLEVKYLDLDSGQILHTYSPLGSYYASQVERSKPCLFYRDLATSIRDYDNQGSVKIPTSYDPTWSTLEWKEVDKDGYILDKYRYYQIEVTLKSKTSSDNAYVNNITIPPVVRLQEIYSEQNKPFYIKTDIPAGVESANFSGKIKCWWSS